MLNLRKNERADPAGIAHDCTNVNAYGTNAKPNDRRRVRLFRHKATMQVSKASC